MADPSLGIIEVEAHPLLRVAAFATTFPAPLSGMEDGVAVADLLRLDALAPLQRDDELRGAIREMLRHGGYKPAGRGKPASEYLVRAAGDAALGSINLAVDVCNAVSLHSGFPISLVDLELAHPPFRIAVAPTGSSYVFNRGGQEIDLGGLVCLFDLYGPCANAIRDSQRTKTRPETVHTLSIIWGVAGHEGRLRQAEGWYRELLDGAGARSEGVEVTRSDPTP